MIFIDVKESIHPDEIKDADESYRVLRDVDFIKGSPPPPYITWEPAAIVKKFVQKGFDLNQPVERVINERAGLRYRQKLIIVSN